MVSCDVTLSPAGAPAGAASGSPEPVVGSFVENGLVFAVTGEGQVRLVASDPAALLVGGATAEGVSDAVSPDVGAEGDLGDSEPGADPASPDAGAGSSAPSAIALPVAVAHDGASYELASIGPHAFDGCGAAAARIPAGVSAIDPAALASATLERVEVDSANPAFASFDGALYDADRSCLLSIPGGRKGAVRIPDNTEEVSPSAFSHAAGVDAISVDAGGNAFASWDGLLYDASGATLLRVPPGVGSAAIREGCTAIAAGALAGCASLRSIQAPTSVTEVSPEIMGDGAEGLRGASVALPAGAEEASVVDGPDSQADCETVTVLLPGEDTRNVWENAGFKVETLAPASVRDGQLLLTSSATVGGVHMNGGTLVRHNADGSSYTLPSRYFMDDWTNFTCNLTRISWWSKGIQKTEWVDTFLKPGYQLIGWSTSSTATSGKTSFTYAEGCARWWYAVWKPIDITLTFDPVGGVFPDGTAEPLSNRSPYRVNATLSEVLYPDDSPSRPEYHFRGWFTSISGGTAVSASTALPTTSYNTFYARWGYTLTFEPGAEWDAAGVGRHDDMAMERGGQPFEGELEVFYAIAPTLPVAERTRGGEPTGYRFCGWGVRQTDGSLRRVEAAELGAAGDDLAADLRPNGDAKLTLCALWEPLSYAISLDPVEPGAEGGDRTLSVAFDAPLPEASVPSCEGKAFLGYFSEPDGLGEMWYDHRGRPTHADAQGLPCYDVAGGVTLYAAWAEGSFLELDPSPGKWRDGSAEPERLGPFATGQELALPEPPARAGWIFAGWAEEGSDEALVGSRESHVVPDEARPLARPGQTARLHALWVPGIDVDMQLGGPASVTYSVFQDAEGGDRADGSKTLLSDVGGAHGGPTADGSVPASLLDVSFAYWQDWSRGPSDAPVRFRNGAAGSPMDLYATSVLGEGATGDGGLFRSAADAREAVAVVTPLGDGVDWAYQDGAERMELSLDGGSRLVGTIAAGEGCPEGEQGAHALGELECALTVDLKGAAVDFGSGNSLVEDVARIVWTASVRSDVSFDPNGATGGSVPASLVATLGQVLPDVGGEPPSRDGYEFTGWWDSPDSLLGEGTRYCDEQGRGIRAWDKVGSATLYAGWAYRQVELSWDAGEGAFPDGSHAMSTSQEFRDGAVVALPRAADGALAEPVRRGHAFLGWFDAPQGGSQVLDGQSPLPSADAAFHARWQALSYELSFDPNGGTAPDGAAYPALQATFGSALPSPPAAPAREGHAFVGWFDGPDWRAAAKVYAPDSSPVLALWDRDSDVALYAGWAVEHEVSYCINHKNYSGFVSADMPLSHKVLDGEDLAVFDLTPHVSQAIPMRFAGWSLASGIGNRLDYPVGSTIPDVRSDLTLYTCWEAK